MTRTGLRSTLFATLFLAAACGGGSSGNDMSSGGGDMTASSTGGDMASSTGGGDMASSTGGGDMASSSTGGDMASSTGGGDMASSSTGDGGGGPGTGNFAAGGDGCAAQSGIGCPSGTYGYNCAMNGNATPPEPSCSKMTVAGLLVYCCPDPLCVHNTFFDNTCVADGNGPHTWSCPQGVKPSDPGCKLDTNTSGYCCND